MRRVLLTTTLVTLAVTAAPAAASAACKGADASPATASPATIRSATLCLLNVERRRHHLPPLRSSTDLRRMARSFAKEMVSEHFFDHTAPNGTTFRQRVKRSRYVKRARRYSAGENIGTGTPDMATPRQMVDAWMHSPGHRRNILDPKFRDIGIGVVPGSPDVADATGATYVTDFGRRLI
jgi:uncharacterized protein YkwD